MEGTVKNQERKEKVSMQPLRGGKHAAREREVRERAHNIIMC